MPHKILRSLLVSLVMLALCLLASQPVPVRALPATLPERIAQYKAALGAPPNASQQKTIALRCGVAQTAISNLQPSVAKVQASRNTAYTNIATQLNDLLKKLGDQAFETTKLQEIVNTLQAKTTTYTTTMTTYKQAVDDLTTINCTADPVAFQAALSVARTAHDNLTPQVTDIRAYIINTVKPELQQIQSQLNQGQTTGGNQ